ncbi:hypothetical protein ACHQM5_023077 [Ranunculus cassubicifolius]
MAEPTFFRKSRSGYEQLGVVFSTEFNDITSEKEDKQAHAPAPAQISRSVSRSASKKVVTSHPIFNVPDARKSKKAMKKPEFMRYIQYMKEGGTWDADANRPSIYFK